GLVQFFLNRDSIVLDLPTMVSSSIVCYFQKVFRYLFFHHANVININLAHTCNYKDQVKNYQTIQVVPVPDECLVLEFKYKIYHLSGYVLELQLALT